MYSNAYLAVLPSDIEGMSLSLLEALSYGNAVLCSDIPENTSVAEDKAMYFKKGDVKDLSEKLSLLCRDAAAAERLAAGADEFILKKYSWQSVANDTHELYKRALNS